MAIQPRVLRGFRDFFPAEILAREKIVSTIKNTYESYGFVPLATPSLEYKETLLSYGEETGKQIYLFKDLDGVDVGMRFDLTVPLCRVIAQYRELPRPFKRYQIQPVWRYDKPDPGRFREFIQFDIDSVGSASMAADAEIISAMHDCLNNLELQFRIRFSSRKILNTLIQFAEITPDMAHCVFRVIDKLDKQGIDAVKEELGEGRKDASGDEIQGLRLQKAQIDKIEQFLLLQQPTRIAAIDAIEHLFHGVQSAEEGIRELREIHDYLTAFDIADDRVMVDFTIARGLDYYTGPVFEAILIDAPQFGSIMGGGRYDQLIEHFIGESVPATGASIGVDRLFSVMQQLGKLELRPSTADVIVTTMVKDKISEYQRVAYLLRRAGIKTELYTGTEGGVGSQLKYADKQAIPIAIIIGPDEFTNNQVSIKDLRVTKKGKVDIKDRGTWLKTRVGQKTISRDILVEEIKNMLQAKEQTTG